MSTDAGRPSNRAAQAEATAHERLRHQRDLLRPLGWAVIAVVTATAMTTPQTPDARGGPAVVTFALAGYAATTAIAISGRFLDQPRAVQVAVIALMGATGVCLVVLQPRGATGLAVGAAVWMAITRLPLTLGVVLAVALALGQDVAALRGGATTAAVLAATLLNVLLGLVAYVVSAARAAQNRTELLLAQLADAQDEQARAATRAERGRIAAELHDVLAHCLSGAAIQLQGARVLATRESASAPVREAIERASNLVNDGLVNARAAVGALRGEPLPGVAELDRLVAGFRRDFGVPASLTVQGQPHPLGAETDLLLYRAAQEALTNIARYAPGVPAFVSLHYQSDRVCLTVRNQASGPHASGSSIPAPPGLATVGGGRGRAGLSDRLVPLGGSLHAGPRADGWQVDVEVPA
jgi:signal transduction histidine kinase